jgi:Protein of unknown function (DUF3631)
MTISIAEVLAAEPQGPCVPLAWTLKEVSDFFSRYVTFPKEAHNVAATLWAAHTWVVMDAFDYTPYLHISSPVKRCGKTRVFDCLQMLCKNAWPVISPSEAVLFRKIEQDGPTILVDEVDAIFKQNGTDENKEGLRALLNAGFYRGTTVPRCVGPQFTLTEFRVFCPKALAGIGQLPDTVADRSITIVMARQIPGQSEKFRSREVGPIAKPIAEALQNWAARLETIQKLHAARPKIPTELSDRAADICEPLLAIADMAGGTWPDLARSSLIELCAESEASDENIGVQLLGAIREIFTQSGEDRLSTKDLLQALIERDNGEPWAGWWARDLKNENTQGPSGKLARILKPFRIVPETIRTANGNLAKGYKLESLRDVFSRYIAR